MAVGLRAQLKCKNQEREKLFANKCLILNSQVHENLDLICTVVFFLVTTLYSPR